MFDQCSTACGLDSPVIRCAQYGSLFLRYRRRQQHHLAILRLDLAKPGYLMHFGRLFYELEASEVAQPWFKGPSIQPPVAVGGHSRLRPRVFHVKRDMRVCRLSRDGMLVHRAASEG
jgi:hypothetical protein